MADQQQELWRVNWSEAFSFTHIFKSFRMALHANKLILSLVAVLLVVLSGAVLDVVWGIGGGRAHINDPYNHFCVGDQSAWNDMQEAREDARPGRVAAWFREAAQDRYQHRGVMAAFNGFNTDGQSELLTAYQNILNDRNGGENPRTQPDIPNDLQAQAEDDWKDIWGQAIEHTENMLEEAEEIRKEAVKAAEDTIDDITDDDDREEAQERLERHNALMNRAIWVVELNRIDQRERQLKGRGVFSVLADYEMYCFDQAVRAVRLGNFFTGLDTLMAARQDSPSAEDVANTASQDPINFGADQNEPEGVGLFGWLALMGYGLIWLLLDHTFYALIFLAVTLVIWALFGGAVARIAALDAAREERISWAQALKFSAGKFFSFLTAPLIPVVLIVVLAVVIGLGGLAMTLPIVDIILAVLFPLALILGGLIAFLLINLVAGAPLMYPTIAVEGSDSFDAISRSFSYVFGSPWRYLLYTIVAAIYGTICYLFVRGFIFLTLLATHWGLDRGIVGLLGLGANKAPELADGATKTDLLWKQPEFWDLISKPNYAAMSGVGGVAATIMHVFLFVVVALLAAFVLSYCVSAHTVIYYLLRRKVDATDLDDVYIEEPEELEEEIMPPAEGGEAEAPEAEEPKQEEPEGESHKGEDDKGEDEEEPKGD